MKKLKSISGTQKLQELLEQKKPFFSKEELAKIKQKTSEKDKTVELSKNQYGKLHYLPEINRGTERSRVRIMGNDKVGSFGKKRHVQIAILPNDSNYYVVDGQAYSVVLMLAGATIPCQITKCKNAVELGKLMQSFNSKQTNMKQKNHIHLGKGLQAIEGKKTDFAKLEEVLSMGFNITKCVLISILADKNRGLASKDIESNFVIPDYDLALRILTYMDKFSPVSGGSRAFWEILSRIVKNHKLVEGNSKIANNFLEEFKKESTNDIWGVNDEKLQTKNLTRLYTNVSTL